MLDLAELMVILRHDNKESYQNEINQYTRQFLTCTNTNTFLYLIISLIH